MASKLSFLNSLMERKKPKDETHELTLVKAAAWAWHQHNSSSEGKVTSEFDVTRTRHAPRPSRYKLEVMRMAKAKEEKGGSPIHSRESLLDAYEVESISRVLNSFIESNNNKIVNGSADASVDIGDRMRNKKKKKMKKKKIRKGFWLGHGAVCGREEDVVDHRALRDGHRQSAKHVPVVNMVKCLPTTNAAI